MINKEELKSYLEQGLSSRDIEKITGIPYHTLLYWIKKWELQSLNKYKKPVYKDINYFSKINTPEKAYILGFILGDGYITKDNKLVVSIALHDKEVIDFIHKELNVNVVINTKLDHIKKIYPNASFKIGNSPIINDLKCLFGGRLKEERHIPIISPKLEKYLVQGFFDAEGCVTWGRRKDRNRIWSKISFTSQYKMLIGIQNILIKNGISSVIRPKNNEKCYVLEISKTSNVLKFLDFIYSDDNFIVLNRKYEKAKALRLELGEFGGSLNSSK